MTEFELGRILIKDGGVSTMLCRTTLGQKYPFCEILNTMHPEVVENLHAEYVNAGADILTTNTFSANPAADIDFQSENLVREFNFEGAKIARKVADSAKKQVYVAGSMGIYRILLGKASKEEVDKYLADYQLQADALCAGGADFIMLETIWHPDLADIIAYAIQEVLLKHKKRIGFCITVDETWELPTGDTVEDFVQVFSAYNPLFLGINCSNEPKSIINSAFKLADVSKFPVLIAPNAGLPNINGNYPLNPANYFNEMKPLIDSGKFAIIGGCCGTTPEHIKLLSDYIRSKR